MSAIAVHTGHATGSAFVTLPGRRQPGFRLQHQQQRCRPDRLDAAAERLLAGADHIHVMGSSLFSDRVIGSANQAIDVVKAKGGTVSFDPNIRKEIMKAIRHARSARRRCSTNRYVHAERRELFLFSSARETKKGAVAELLGTRHPASSWSSAAPKAPATS